MRCRKGFVKIHVQHIKAHITWFDLAEDGVEVGTIVVEQATGLVDDPRDIGNLPFKNATGRGIGHHQTSRLRSHRGSQRFDVHIAVAVDGHLAHLIAAHDGGCRVRPMRRVRNQYLVARVIGVGVVVGADHGHTSELALRTRHRRQGYAAHTGQVPQDLLQEMETLEIPLADTVRRERVAPEKSGMARCAMRASGVVLHRARTQRIELIVDGKVFGRQVSEVAHHLQFRYLRQAWLSFTQPFSGYVIQDGSVTRGGKLSVCTPFRLAEFEDARHRSTLWSAAP